MGCGQQAVAPGRGVCLMSSGFKGISFHACASFISPLPLSLSSTKVHQDSHRPDWRVRGCGVICLPGYWKSQACCLLEQEGQEGQLSAYRGGCHSAQRLTPTVAA